MAGPGPSRTTTEIPAFAGTTPWVGRCGHVASDAPHPPGRSSPFRGRLGGGVSLLRTPSHNVIPAQAGTSVSMPHRTTTEIPAFAGTTPCMRLRAMTERHPGHDPHHPPPTGRHPGLEPPVGPILKSRDGSRLKAGMTPRVWEPRRITPNHNVIPAQAGTSVSRPPLGSGQQRSPLPRGRPRG